jgi:hydroxymethylpyrimidine pyrophosphatase-like HAD family hydrolase
MDKLKKVKEDLAQIEDIEITSSWFNNVEIMHKGVNKGEALKALINYLGIQQIFWI